MWDLHTKFIYNTTREIKKQVFSCEILTNKLYIRIIGTGKAPELLRGPVRKRPSLLCRGGLFFGERIQVP